jgi:hypothetical protein
MTLNPNREDSFDLHFKIVSDGAERTRGILYFFCLVLIVSVMSTANSYLRTDERRLEILNGAVACLENGSIESEKVPLKSFDEKQGDQQYCKYYYNYITRNYDLNVRVPVDINKPTEPEKHSLASLREKRLDILKQYDDNAFITVPILNFKVDLNFQTSLQSLMSALIFFVLALSLSAEQRALNDIRPFVDDRMRAKAIINSHVFLRTSALNYLIWLFLFMPTALAAFAIVDDFRVFEAVLRDLYPGRKGWFFYSFEFFAFSACFGLAVTCYWLAYSLRSSLLSIEKRSTLASQPLEAQS